MKKRRPRRHSDEPQAPIPISYLRREHPAILLMTDFEHIGFLHLLGLCYMLQRDVLPCAYSNPATLAHDMKRDRRTVERLLTRMHGHKVIDSVTVPDCNCQTPHIRVVGLRRMWPDMQWRCDENGGPITQK